MNFDFRKIINLVEQYLTESTLTKGSLHVMNNANLVANLADAVRDDSMTNPSSFPPGFGRKAQKMPDEELAKWFLDNLDQIERQGYEGVQYSRDGVNNMWVVNRYIAGGHNWEDISGTLAMNLAKWYFLKNRNMLDAAHSDIPKFSSVRDLGQYMVYHYTDKLAELEKKLKAAALKKTVRAYKLIDNDDYRVYIIFNRAASCMYGLGSNWCTANTASGSLYHSYAAKAMLFQLYPYDAPEMILSRGGKTYTGNERYQFDASGPNFMDLADNPANRNYIRERFPYLYTDLVDALKSQKSDIEAFMQQAADDPTLQTDDAKVKEYNVDEEIKKLSKFVETGYGTTEKRPAAPKEAEPKELPQQPANPS